MQQFGQGLITVEKLDQERNQKSGSHLIGNYNDVQDKGNINHARKESSADKIIPSRR